MKDYLVIYEQGEDGTWGAYSPDLWGVIASADTLEETKALMREALPAHVEALREAGLEVPEPTHQVAFIAA
ncbi:MAG: type II toxin-antitoxin system HicB family antitoxin [Actinobacteria bacterium]|nr:type II toxin-antitoxin system HicB family antitoxin [Actinomycetota bacterium]